MDAAVICGYVIDAVCVAMVLLMVIYGAVKGFAAVFTGMIAFFAGAAGGALSAYFLSGLIYDHLVGPQVLRLLQHAAASPGAGSAADSLIAGLEQLPGFLQQGIQAVAGDVPEKIRQLAEQAQTDLPEAVSVHLIRPVVMFLTGILIFLLVFILLLILFRKLSHLLEKVSKVPLVGGVNRVLGGVMGLLQGGVSALLLLSVLWLILLLSGGGWSWFSSRSADTSFFLRTLTEFYAAPL